MIKAQNWKEKLHDMEIERNKLSFLIHAHEGAQIKTKDEIAQLTRSRDKLNRTIDELYFDSTGFFQQKELPEIPKLEPIGIMPIAPIYSLKA